MEDTILFGLTLVGALFVVMAIVACGIAIAFRLKARECASRAEAARQKVDEKIIRIQNRLIVKVWSCSTQSDDDEDEEEEKPQVDLEANQETCLSAASTNDDPRHNDLDSSGHNSYNNDEDVSSQDGLPQKHGVCAICLGPYHNGEFIVQSCNLACRHDFHRACIAEWLVKKDECPCCRQSFLGKEKDESF